MASTSKKLIAQNKELTRHIFMDNIPQENVHIIEKCKKTIDKYKESGYNM